MSKRKWCAHSEQLCVEAPEFEDEVSGEWWCRSHAGPLAWSAQNVDTVEANRLRRVRFGAEVDSPLTRKEVA